MRLEEYVTPDRSGKKALRWETFAELKDKNFWREIQNSDDIEFDLNGIDIFSHDGLIWLCTISLYRRFSRKHTFVTLPDSDPQIFFLNTLGIAQLRGPAGFIITNEYLLERCRRPHRTNSETIDFHAHRCIQFVSADYWRYFDGSEGFALKNELARQISLHRGGVRGSQDYEELEPYVFWLRELVKNVILHAGERGNGYGFIAHSPMPKALKKLRFVCGDAGPGLCVTLKQQYGFKIEDESHAIAYALLLRGLKEYVPDGTEGFFSALSFVANMGGTVHIRTGDTLCSLYLNENEACERIRLLLEKVRAATETNADLVHEMRGLLVARQLPEIIGVHIAVDLRIL